VVVLQQLLLTPAVPAAAAPALDAKTLRLPCVLGLLCQLLHLTWLQSVAAQPAALLQLTPAAQCSAVQGMCPRVCFLFCIKPQRRLHVNMRV
jgi:hypothetical protein